MVNERRWIAVIFSLYFLLAIGYSLLMPIWEGPDEPAHYLIALTLARQNIYPTPEQNYEAHQPRGYYRVAALAIKTLDKIDKRYSDYFRPYPFFRYVRKPVRIFDWTDENYRFMVGPHVLRWLNILLGGGALWLNWSAFRLLVPAEPSKRVAALALAALTPQYLHIMSAVSNDALGTLAGSLLFYLAIRVAIETTDLLALVSVILGAILPLVTKLTALPAGVVLLCTLAWKQASPRQQMWRWLFTGVILLLLTAFALYIFAPSTILTALDQIQWRTLRFRVEALTPEYLFSMFSQVIWSYWGKVGWLAIGLPGWIVIFLSLFGLFGGSISAYSLPKCSGDCRRNAWIVTWSLALLTIAAVLRNGLTTTYSQGRFLLPAAGALSLLMISGWYNVLPIRFKRILPGIVIFVMVAVNLILWWKGILPVYFQPFFD